MTKSLLHSAGRLTVPIATFLVAACGGSEFRAVPGLSPETGGGAGASAVGAETGVADGGARSGAGKNVAGALGVASAGASAGSSVAGAGSAGSGSTDSGGASTGSGGTGSGGASAGAGSTGSGGATADAGSGSTGSGGASAGAGSVGEAPYSGPTVGTAKAFAVLAYSAITAANLSPLIGDIGVSAGAVSTITGFDAPTDKKYGTDSIAPNTQLTLFAQEDVTALVGNIDPRPCDADYTSVMGGLTGDVTLYPGVTCMNSFANDVLLNGHVTLDARGKANAFFVIRGNLTLTVADAAQVVLANGAEACGVFWRISKQVTIGKSVQFYGTVIAGSAITMTTGSTLVGRALAQTAGVHLDANAITIPSDGLVGSAGVCTHLQ